MKRTPQTLLALILLAAPGAVQVSAEDAFAPQFEVGASLLGGVAKEYVLRDGTYNKPISRLEWDIPLSTQLQLTAVFPWTPQTNTRVSIAGLVPFSAGIMVDEDWNADTLIYGRSQHTAYLTAHWSASAEQRVVFTPISLVAGMKYQWMTWEAWNGSGHYETSTTEDLYFTGLVIAYRQQWGIPYLGLAWNDQFADTFWGAAARFGPYVWSSNMDNHNYAGAATKTFLDYPKGGKYLQAEAEVSWPAERFSWGIRVQGEVTWNAVGSTVVTQTVQSTTNAAVSYSSSANSAGAWFREFAFTVFVRN